MPIPLQHTCVKLMQILQRCMTRHYTWHAATANLTWEATSHCYLLVVCQLWLTLHCPKMPICWIAILAIWISTPLAVNRRSLYRASSIVANANNSNSQTIRLHAHRRLYAGMGWALRMRHSITLRYYTTTAVGSGDCITRILEWSLHVVCYIWLLVIFRKTIEWIHCLKYLMRFTLLFVSVV